MDSTVDLSQKIEISFQDMVQFFNEIEHAILKNDLELIIHLLSQEYKEEADQKWHVCTFFLAFTCGKGYLEIVKYFCEVREADVCGYRGNNCLEEALQNGHLHVVQYLIEEANVRPSKWKDIISSATKCGNLEIVKYMLSAGRNHTDLFGLFVHSDIFSSLFCTATENGHTNILKYILTQNVVVDMQEAVYIAISTSQLDILKYLCEAGASIRFQDIETSSFTSNVPIVKFLVDNYCFQNEEKISLKWIYKPSCFEVARLLYEKGVADISTALYNVKQYLLFCEKMKMKTRERAQKKIYFWWIPICYSLDHPSGCGKRMMQKNWEKTEQLLKGELY